jgi:xanthine phosphoribosyltransferase
MNKLEERIIADGIVLEEKILKVNSFLNHQIDVELLDWIGEYLAKQFNNQPIDKILTIEASGIAFATATSYHLNKIPVVFARKGTNKLTGDSYSAEVYSFTKKTTFVINCDAQFICPGEKILIIDDFLADGNAALGLTNLCQQAKAEVVGIGIVIEKGFQPGRSRLEAAGFIVKSVACIANMKNNRIEFK